MRYLSKNSSHVDQRPGRFIRNSDKVILLTVVNPNNRALERIAEYDDFMVNYHERARDFHMDRNSALVMLDIFDRHFVQPRHGKDEFYAEENGTYTRRNRPGFRFVCYGDRVSKRTGRHCFHIEARAHGVGAVRRIGVHHPRDLLKFRDHEFWQQHLQLFKIDFERLGRWHENRRLGQRRQKPDISKDGYDRDLRIGTALFRVFAETDAFARYCATFTREYSDPEIEERPNDRIIDRSVQKFVDRFGRGPFLHPLDAPLLYATSPLVGGPFIR